jgi:cytochrome P450
MEGQIAINTMLQRLPKLALAIDKPEYRQSQTLRGLQALPVSF